MNRRAERGAAAHRRGEWAEWLYLWHLCLNGSRVLARRYRTPVGEINLVVWRGHTVAAVEVKGAARRAHAAEAVLWKQRGRIARALEHFPKSRPDLGDAQLRFDVMLVAAGHWPCHLCDARRAGE